MYFIFKQSFITVSYCSFINMNLATSLPITEKVNMSTIIPNFTRHNNFNYRMSISAKNNECGMCNTDAHFEAVRQYNEQYQVLRAAVSGNPVIIYETNNDHSCKIIKDERITEFIMIIRKNTERKGVRMIIIPTLNDANISAEFVNEKNNDIHITPYVWSWEKKCLESHITYRESKNPTRINVELTHDVDYIWNDEPIWIENFTPTPLKCNETQFVEPRFITCIGGQQLTALFANNCDNMNAVSNDATLITTVSCTNMRKFFNVHLLEYYIASTAMPIFY